MRELCGILTVIILLSQTGTGLAGEIIDNGPPPAQPVDNGPAKVVWAATTKQVTTTPVTDVSVSYRQPIGHTHTCSSCGLTWDHQANPTHTCQNCGAEQWRQDAYPKPVPIKTVKPATQPITIQAEPTQVYTLPTAVSGCPNGKCSVQPQTVSVPQRRGLFR